MKVLGLGAASAVAMGLLVGPAMATDLLYSPVPQAYAPMPMGDLKIDFGASFSRDEEDDHWSFIDIDGEARAFVPLSSFNLQLDIGAYAEIYEEGYSETESVFQAHAWHKADAHAYGLFGGVGFAGEGTAAWSIGVEGEHYLGNTTLGASLAYAFGSADYGWSPSAVTVGGSVEHYINPDHKISFSFDYDWYDELYTVTDFDAVLSAEKRVTGTAFSYYVEGEYSAWKEDGCCDGTRWSAKVGARVAVGGTPGMTLQEHDRYLPWDNAQSRPVFWGGNL